MAPSNNLTDPVVFKPRSGKWYAAITWILLGIGAVTSVTVDGLYGVVAAWPLLGLGYFAWWIFWYPSVHVRHDAVVVHNLLRSVTVPWPALIHVDTKFALKLVTTRGNYTAWAAPAPGIWGTHRGKPEHVRNLPESTYGPGQSIRPGDLKNSDSGAVAYLIRTRWAERAEADQLHIGEASAATVTQSIHWLQLGGAAAFIAAVAVAFGAV